MDSREHDNILADTYGAVSSGTDKYEVFLSGVAPSYRLAAMIDSDRFNQGEEYSLPKEYYEGE